MRTKTSTAGRRGVVCALAAAAVTLAAALPTQAATYVYVASSGAGEVFQYGMDSTGALSPLSQPPVAAGNAPLDVAVSPNARWVYVMSSTSVGQFDLGRDGLLAPMTTPTVPMTAPCCGNVTPGGLAVSPDHSSVYLVTGFDSVAQYDVGDDGGLSPKNPAFIPVAPFSDPGVARVASAIAVSPDGRSVYVPSYGVTPANPNLRPSVSQFDVGAGGTLSPKNPPTVPGDVHPTGVVVSPDGHTVYVANSGSDTVSQFDVDATDGTLSPKRVVGAGDAPADLAVSPDGGSVYVANNGDPRGLTGGGSVFQYDAGPDGALTPKRPRSVSAGRNPAGVGMSPDGASVYVTDQGGPLGAGALYQFDVDQNDGTLSAKNPASLPAGTGPGGLAVSPAFATAQADVLTGTADDDVICGRGGSDKISGLGGDDKLYGDRCGGRASAARRRAVGIFRARHDVLLGGAGRDRLYGSVGRDRLRGGPGRDRLRGGPGRDRLAGGAGRDRLRGGPGRDTLHVRGGGRDRVHCGNGRDTVRADKRDAVRRCEHIIRR